MCSQVSYDIYYYTIFLRFHSIANLVYCYAGFDNFAWVSWDSLRTALFNCEFDFYFVSHFTIFLPLLSLSLYFCISDWPEAFLKWLRSTSQMFASFFHFFPLFFSLPHLLFPFSAQSIIMFFLRITQIRFDYVLNWLITLEKRKKLSKNCSTQEFNSINKTENGKIASREGEVVGRDRGSGIAWQRLWERVRVQLGRRQAFDDEDALKFFFFFFYYTLEL